MPNRKCTMANCPMQVGCVDPETCQEPEKCQYATFPRTNADRIRAMTDEELAYFLTTRSDACEKCFFKRWCRKDPAGVCTECTLSWLRAPVEESEGRT